MINILIAEDSATEMALLKHLFESEKDMHVVGCAKNGKEVIELAAKLKPDLITMDIEMPIMGGLEAIDFIMSNTPVPIVVISSILGDGPPTTAFQALGYGAVSVIDKPRNAFDCSYASNQKRMVTLVRSMSELKVIKRRFIGCHLKDTFEKTVIPKFYNPHYEIIALGASVGGPQALRMILSKLPKAFSIPIVVVQHISDGFLGGLCRWLNDHCAITVKCAEHQECLSPGVVYFAPENHHLEIKRVGLRLVAHLEKRPPIAGFCPSITVLLQSIAQTCGKNAIGVLLTGMGADGAEGLLELKRKNGHTIIQDQKSSIVFGMAHVAQSLGAVDEIVNLDQMVKYLTDITSRD